jgi:hypothetical protein
VTIEYASADRERSYCPDCGFVGYVEGFGCLGCDLGKPKPVTRNTASAPALPARRRTPLDMRAELYAMQTPEQRAADNRTRMLEVLDA